MDNVISSKAFADILKSKGFRQHKDTFSRCHGAGILQVVYTGNQDYISPESSNYSAKNRKSNRITFGVYSMFADLPEYCFEPNSKFAMFHPENLYGYCSSHYSFRGIQGDYLNFLGKGIDFLDSTKDQQSLLANIEIVAKAEFGGILPHWTQLCAPYLICGKTKEALGLISGRYIQNWDSFHKKFDCLIDGQHYEEYFQHMFELTAKLDKYVDLYYAILQNKQAHIDAYLQNNYKQNVAYANQYNIPFTEDYTHYTGLQFG